MKIKGTRLLEGFERIYVVLSLLFFTNGIVQTAVAETDVAGQSQPVVEDRYGQLLICIILIPLVILHWKKIVAGLRHAGWLIALCALAVASAYWSHDWRLTSRRGILLSAATLFAVYLASRFDWDEQLDLFGWVSVVSVLGSAFMAIFVPYYGISHDIHFGAVKGIFPHKNILGRQMVFAVLTLWLARPRGIPTWLRNLTLLGSGLLLLLSNAVTSMLSLLVCVAMYPVLHLFRIPRKRTVPLWVPLAPLFAMGAFALVANFSAILEAAGRTGTLTGRTGIWRSVWAAIGRHPWLGYGYDVFWNRYTADLATVVQMIQFKPPHAHNGYLDILLALGIVGFFVFLAGLFTNIWRAATLFGLDEIHGNKWPLFVLMFFVVFNFTESNILRLLTFLWIPYASLYVSTALVMAEARARSRAVAGSERTLENNPRVAAGAVPEYGT